MFFEIIIFAKTDFGMRAHSLLLCISMVLAFISCGTQKAAVNAADEGPVVQTQFHGVKFGDSRNKVYNRLYRLRPIKSTDGSYTIRDQEFAGYNWHFVQLHFVEKMLYIVNFQQEFRHETEAKKRFENVYRMLRAKYGEMEVTDSGDGFMFTDAHENMVSISVHLGTSKGGEEYWYCELSYGWGEGALLTFVKSLSEI